VSVKQEYYLHLVWATKKREGVIPDCYEADIYRLIISEAKKLDCTVLAVNGMPDHIHVLVACASAVSPAQLANQLKGVTSAFLNEDARKDANLARFRWQEGYGLFSIGKNQVERVRSYIERQKEHHARKQLWPDWETTPEDEYQKARAASSQ
jgi:putative transposase